MISRAIYVSLARFKRYATTVCSRLTLAVASLVFYGDSWMSVRRSAGLFLAVALAFGGTFVAAKAGLSYFPPLLFVALRFDIAAALLGGYVLVTRQPAEVLPSRWDDVIGILATGGFVIGLANALLFVGQQSTSSGVGAILFSLVPILTPIFGAVVLAESPVTFREAIGLAIGLVGVSLVVGPDLSILFAGDAVGQGLMVLGASSAALGAVLIRRVDPDLSSTVRIAWGLPLAAGIGHGASILLGESVTAIVWTSEAVLTLSYVSLVAGVFAYIAYFGLLDRAGAVYTNLVFYAVPVVAATGGVVFLGETLTQSAILGFGTIFLGFMLIGSESVNWRSWLVVDRRESPSEAESDQSTVSRLE